ncbi:MAG TPA: hypothetical protein VJ842_11830 [Pyrinomonadaceae bacterium]|nr:hypothetical protein [Pyrinomonadaceae bacterium]
MKLLAACVVLCVLSLATAGQTSRGDIARLSERLNVPASALIVNSGAARLPAGASLKIYIASVQDKTAYARFVKWADKWNRNEGARHGSLQVVNDLTQADIVLARFHVRESTPRPRTTVSVGSIHDPTRDRNASSPKISTRTYTPTAEYSYLLARSADVLTILYGDVDRTYIQDYSDPDGDLLRQLEAQMKKR